MIIKIKTISAEKLAFAFFAAVNLLSVAQASSEIELSPIINDHVIKSKKRPLGDASQNQLEGSSQIEKEEGETAKWYEGVQLQIIDNYFDHTFQRKKL